MFGLIRGQNNPKTEFVAPGAGRQTGHRRPDRSVEPAAGAAESAQPDEVYNLGAVCFVAYSWEQAALTTEVTGTGVLNILEAIRLHAADDPSRVRFYQASSSEMFGKVQETPQTERPCCGRARRTAWPRSSATT